MTPLTDEQRQEMAHRLAGFANRLALDDNDRKMCMWFARNIRAIAEVLRGNRDSFDVQTIDEIIREGRARERAGRAL
jgi:hypothetical protein